MANLELPSVNKPTEELPIEQLYPPEVESNKVQVCLGKPDKEKPHVFGVRAHIHYGERASGVVEAEDPDPEKRVCLSGFTVTKGSVYEHVFADTKYSPIIPDSETGDCMYTRFVGINPKAVRLDDGTVYLHYLPETNIEPGDYKVGDPAGVNI